MKAYLFVLLLAVTLCSTVPVKTVNPVEVVLCLAKNPVVVNVVTQLVTAALANDWLKVLEVVMANYPKLVDGVKQCLPALA